MSLYYPRGAQPDRKPAREDVTVRKLIRWIGQPSIDGSLQHVNSDGDPQDQARAARLAANPEFRDWLTREQAGHLVVHGNYDHASLVSGLSLFCNSLRYALSGDTPRCIPLVFFCGLHTGPPNRPSLHADIHSQPGPPSNTAAIGRALETGGHIMVRSLIYQLIKRLGRNLVIPINCDDILPIQAGSITALCKLLSHILFLMPCDVTVWCLVDGLEFYEQSRSWFDVKMVLSHLARHANPRDDMGGAWVRLLLTTPTAMSRASEVFAQPQAVSLAPMPGEQAQLDSRTLRRRLAAEVEQAHGYFRSTVPASDPWNGFWVWPQEWTYEMALRMPITFPGQARGDQLPVSHNTNRQPYYFF